MLPRRKYEGGPVSVPAEVARGLEEVRRSGATNMLDRPMVIDIARRLEYDEAADWIEANRSAYAELVFRGLEVDDDH